MGRRQIKLPFRKPLIIMTPKSLLRHPQCKSSFDDLNAGQEFQRMILDQGPASENPAAVQTIEQISPFPFDIMKKVSDTYCNAELCFVQEEHKNMGVWSYVQPRTQTAIGGYHRLIQYIGRETAPSPATVARPLIRRNSTLSSPMLWR